MATTIQLLRSDVPSQRPDPGVLANGVPMVNLHEDEPGLFFSARDGSLFKVGPVFVGTQAPNINPEGEPGNTRGELWLDTSGNPELKVFDGSSWVPCFLDPGGTVTSVGLQFTDLFNVSGGPVTTSGVLEATLRDQDGGFVFAGPPGSGSGTPLFRPLEEQDIPQLNASKITSGQFDSGRIPGLDASKIATGVFNDARIPNLNMSKISSGILDYDQGGTGISSTPGVGELLIGTGLSWAKATLSAGSTNIEITNGLGSVSVDLADDVEVSTLDIRDSNGDTITLAAANVSIPYTLILPVSDGTSGSVLTTNGAGQLSFQSSLTGIGSVSAIGALNLFAGGANEDITLHPTGSGSVSVSLSRITDVADPSDASDAATKAYVDTIAAGVQPKAQVVAATTGNISLTGEQTIDGVAALNGDRVLVKDQSFAPDNGIYVVSTGAWSRSSDADSFSKLSGAITFVSGGATHLGESYLCTSSAGGTIGVDDVEWVIYSSGTGTVSSVGLAMPSMFTVSGSPVTSAGTLTTSLASQTANRIFAGPTGGGSATPSFRALVGADIPATLGSHTMTSLGVTGNVTLGSDASDTLTVNALLSSSILLDADSSYTLGSDPNRFSAVYADNLYTGDLHLSNEGRSNSVDGSWGKYTVEEGEDDLFLINLRSGKRYKFVLQEV